MFPGFPEVDEGVLTRMLRRIMLSALIMGVGGIVVALLLSSPWAALGIALGVAVAVINLRFLGSGVASIDTEQEVSEKSVKRILGMKTATRLLIITVVAIGLVIVEPPLGIGMVVGLVIFQIAFVLNVGRTIASSGVA